MLFWFLPVLLILSLFLTGVLRRYALSRSIIDIPNARSSHTVPTPRGGGVAIVISFLLALPLLYSQDLLWSWQAISLGGAGLLIAVIGFLDDHGHIAARWRLLGHFFAAIWSLAWLGGLPPLELLGTRVDLSWAGHILACFYLVWMLNLYNFMDGIDGLASIEAVTACLSCGLIYYVFDYHALIWAPVALAFTVGGFLFWNFPPARIFMGDAGSGFLGIILAVLSLIAAYTAPELFWVWLIVLGVFIVDATFTLFRRLLRGDKVYEAHRSHAYQYASRQVGSHKPVTLSVAAINICWLLPVAYLMMKYQIPGVFAVSMAYAPLVLLAAKFHAGAAEKPD